MITRYVLSVLAFCCFFGLSSAYAEPEPVDAGPLGSSPVVVIEADPPPPPLSDTPEPPAVLALGIVIALVGATRQVLAKKSDFWASGRGAVVLTFGYGFLVHLTEVARANDGAVTWDGALQAWTLIGGAAAFYALVVRPFLLPAIDWVFERTPDNGIIEKALLFLLTVLDKPDMGYYKPGRPGGLSTSPSFLDDDELDQANGGGLSTSPSSPPPPVTSFDDEPTKPRF